MVHRGTKHGVRQAVTAVRLREGKHVGEEDALELRGGEEGVRGLRTA